jgi:hypothetical protein
MTKRSQRDGLNGTRKAEKALRLGRTVSAAGPSLLESLEKMLFDAMGEYLSLRYLDSLQEDNVDEKKLGITRGEVRGLARAIAKIRLPYEDQRIVTKQIEKEFLRKVKNNVRS